MIDEESAHPFVLRRADALLAGYTDAELARAVRRKDLLRLQRGTYLEDPLALPEDATARHALVVAATVAG